MAEKQGPGISVQRLKAGVKIMVETEKQVYEMVVVRPDLGLLQVTSTDPVLHQPTIGQFLGSGDIADWLSKGLCMSLRFRGGLYVSAPVLSAEVKTPTWRYVVF